MHHRHGSMCQAHNQLAIHKIDCGSRSSERVGLESGPSTAAV